MEGPACLGLVCVLARQPLDSFICDRNERGTTRRENPRDLSGQDTWVGSWLSETTPPSAFSSLLSLVGTGSSTLRRMGWGDRESPGRVGTDHGGPKKARQAPSSGQTLSDARVPGLALPASGHREGLRKPLIPTSSGHGRGRIPLASLCSAGCRGARGEQGSWGIWREGLLYQEESP